LYTLFAGVVKKKFPASLQGGARRSRQWQVDLQSGGEEFRQIT